VRRTALKRRRAGNDSLRLRRQQESIKLLRQAQQESDRNANKSDS